MDKIFSMRVFSRVAETGNFSAVAKYMDCSAGNISRAVVSLEAHLHTRLLQRTTRSVSLTECGERYYHRCKQILAELDAADAEASNAHTLPRGRLRVHAVPDIGLKQLTSTIVEYREAFPAVSVDLKLLPRMPNLVEDEFDVSIVSASSLPDSRNVSKLIGRCERILVAAPDYLARHPIVAVSDLSNHALMQVNSSFDPPSEWPEGASGEVDGGTGLAGHFVVNNMQALRVALLEGAGVGAVPTYSVIDDIRAGRLVQLFPDYPLQNTNVFVVYPSRQYVDAKLKTFVDFLTTSLRQKLDLRIASFTPGRLAQSLAQSSFAASRSLVDAN
ncbi:LysR family transcriptional regulator [Paraburkholderia sp. BCC1884]|uniref:LysR family transcriptional regulator n=1 Tax=Paraburkholderia sp. BCC1884 TaxID=2562668 RepID=UPI001184018F|nr:LysR family transcriptional regulator [Paraburkholderia sp. BCC1884]